MNIYRERENGEEGRESERETERDRDRDDLTQTCKRLNKEKFTDETKENRK